MPKGYSNQILSESPRKTLPKQHLHQSVE